ncbi:unnamed protein product, partial [Amoebophrya sp. A25]|eukprot:GSA25T00007528001.1
MDVRDSMNSIVMELEQLSRNIGASMGRARSAENKEKALGKQFERMRRLVVAFSSLGQPVSKSPARAG